MIPFIKYKINLIFWTLLLNPGVFITAQETTNTNYNSPKIYIIKLRPYLNSSKIPLETQKKLEKIAHIIQQFPEIKLRIETHDSGYNFEKDKKISKAESQTRSSKLAKNLEDFLLRLGVSKDKMNIKGKGAESPFVFQGKDPKDNFTLDESKYSFQKNARILLYLIPKHTDDNINLELILESEKIDYCF